MIKQLATVGSWRLNLVGNLEVSVEHTSEISHLKNERYEVFLTNYCLYLVEVSYHGEQFYKESPFGIKSPRTVKILKTMKLTGVAPTVNCTLTGMEPMVGHLNHT